MPYFFFLTTGFSLLGHEFFTEGYFFDWRDIFVLYMTHEKALLIVLIASLILAYQKSKSPRHATGHPVG